MCKTIILKMPKQKQTVDTDQINCKYKKNGCSFKQETLQMEAHEKECLYNYVYCDICQAKVLNVNLYKHQMAKGCNDLVIKRAMVKNIRKTNNDILNHYFSLKHDMQKKRNATRQGEHSRAHSVCGYRPPVPWAYGDRSSPRPLSGRSTMSYDDKMAVVPLRHTMDVCRRCSKVYRDKSNTETSCRWHAGVSTYFVLDS